MIKRKVTVKETTPEINSDSVNQTPAEEVAKVAVPKPVTRRRTTATTPRKTVAPTKSVTPRKTATPKKPENVDVSKDIISEPIINQETPEIMKDYDKKIRNAQKINKYFIYTLW